MLECEGLHRFLTSVSGDAMLKIGDFSRLTQVPIKTLRYYDQTGLLKPAEIDRFTGYRFYKLDQLPRLSRILVLKDLGFSLEQIAHMLDDDLQTEEIRGMLRLKRMELQQHVEKAQARLTRLEIRLKQIEMEDKMPDYEIVLKRVEPQRVLSSRQIVPTVAAIGRLLDEIKVALRTHRIRTIAPWIIMYHHPGYRNVDLDIEVAIPVDVSAPDKLAISNHRQMTMRVIPAIEMAVSTLLHGSYDEFGEVYQTLNTYIHTHGHNYLGPAREIYLRGPNDIDDPSEYLTEIQYPVGEFTEELTIDGVALPTAWENSGAQHLQFTRRARTALEFAKVEAIALQQVYINPEHILIGLLRDSDGFAGHVLGGLGITIEQMRTLSPRGQSRSTDLVVSKSSRQVISYANAEAQQLEHDYIGTEHLLLGLAHQGDGSVIHLLSTSGVGIDQVRAAVVQSMSRS
jgi:DNA-binding transcriptional MerR regulator